LSEFGENRLELLSLRKLFSYSKWIYLSNWINSFIVDYPTFAMSSFMVPASSIGVFSRSMTFVNLGRSILNPLAKIIFPFFRAGESNVIKNYIVTVLLSFLIFFPMTIVIALFSKEIIVYVYGSSF
ncbi:oligosaccharide flippase family protein, partial [Photobacterium sanguinicancri]